MRFAMAGAHPDVRDAAQEPRLEPLAARVLVRQLGERGARAARCAESGTSSAIGDRIPQDLRRDIPSMRPVALTAAGVAYFRAAPTIRQHLDVTRILRRRAEEDRGAVRAVSDASSRSSWPRFTSRRRSTATSSDDALRLVARTLDLPYAHVYGVATFYTMFRREPGGTNTIRMCTNISCMLRGGYEVLEAFEQKLGAQEGRARTTELHARRGGVHRGVCERAVRGRRHEVLPRHHARRRSTRSSRELEDEPAPEVEVV